MTQATSVRCQHCGASLKISDGLRFITCGYCQSELEVVKDESAVYTETLTRLQENSDAMAESIKVIEVQNEIERLDREWQVWEKEELPALVTLRNEQKREVDIFRTEGGMLFFAALMALLFGIRALAAFSQWKRHAQQGIPVDDDMSRLVVSAGIAIPCLIALVVKGIPRLTAKEPVFSPSADQMCSEAVEAYKSRRALLLQQLTALRTGVLPASEMNTSP